MNQIRTKIEDFLDIHENKTIIVCGCGTSIKELVNPEKYITIGVNDLQRLFVPDYLLVTDDLDAIVDYEYITNRRPHIYGSKAKYVFSAQNLKLENPEKLIRYKFNSKGRSEIDLDGCEISFSWTSVFPACIIAYMMGARRIGVIGLDFTDNHFYGNTGEHVLKSRIDLISKDFMNLHLAMKARGVEFFNLSKTSLVQFPYLPLDRF